jgi:hypothetical protein
MSHAITVAQTKLIISEEIPNPDNPDQPDVHLVCIYVTLVALLFLFNLDPYV